MTDFCLRDDVVGSIVIDDIRRILEQLRTREAKSRTLMNEIGAYHQAAEYRHSAKVLREALGLLKDYEERKR